MIWILKLLFAIILLAMLAVTTWASLIESVLVGGAKIIQEPWGIATLFDTYFAFLTFYLWVYYKESSWLRRIGWFVGIVVLGNIAMAAYMLIQLQKLKAGEKIEKLLIRKEA